MQVKVTQVDKVKEGVLLTQKQMENVNTTTIEVSTSNYPMIENDSVCLNIMMLAEELKDKTKLITLIESLESFEFVFHNLFIVIDSKNKSEDALYDRSDCEELKELLITHNIVVKNCHVCVSPIEYKSKSEEYKHMLMQLFSYPNKECVKISATYKNAFAYYYSLFNSPTQYMFHIDIPRAGRVKYIKSNHEYESNHYISKALYLLQNYKKTCFVGLLADYEQFLRHPEYSNEFVAYFDNKIQISLQCWVCDTQRWSPLPGRYNHNMYKYQTENAISSLLQGKGKTSLALLNKESSVNKVGFSYKSNNNI